MNESRSRFSKKISGRTQGNGMFKWFMLFVYIVLCSYVFTGWFRWRKWMEIPHWKIVSIGIAFLLLLLASSIFLGKFLPQSEIQLKILQFGNYWIGFLIYVIFFILVCDLIWLLRSLLAFKWSWMGEPLIRTKTGVILLAVFVLGGSFLFTLYGAVHAKKIKTSFHDISISKQADDLKEMKVVLIADLHLGYSVGSKDMEKMVDRINKQDPDLVVLAGDIFDRGNQPMELYFEILKYPNIQVIQGNHDVWLAREIMEKYAGEKVGEYISYNTLSIMEQRMTAVDLLNLARWIKEKPYYINLDLEGRKYQIAHAQTYLTPERIWNKSRFYMGDGHYECFIRGMEEHNEFTSVVGHTATEDRKIWASPSGRTIRIDCGAGYQKDGNLGVIRLNDMEEFYISW